MTLATTPSSILPGDLWPLAAREQEVSAIVATLSGSGARSLLLRGPIGCGATRLLTHAANEAEADGHRVLRLHAMTSTRHVDFGVLGAVMPELMESEHDSRAALTASAILSIRSAGWTAVIVDDVSALDDATASLIHHLVTGGMLALVAAAHDGEPLPEPIAALRVADLLEVLTIAPLDHEGVAALVESAVGGRLEGGSMRRLAVASNGNPLMVIELVRAAAQDGTLHHDHGIWRWDQGATNVNRLADLVDRQLADLSVPSREACALVALADSLTLEEIVALDITVAAAEAEQAGLLVVVRPGEVRMAHPVYARAVADLVPLPPDLAHRLVDHRLVDDTSDPRRLLPVIRILRAAGVLHSADQLVEGAWLALRLGRFDDAQDFARQAIVMDRSVESLRPLAEALLHAPFGDADEATAIYREMLGMALTDDDRADAVIGLHRAAVRDAQRSGTGEGIGIVREELRALADELREGRVRSRVRIELVRSSTLEGDLRHAVDLGVSIIEDRTTDARQRLQALDAISLPAVMVGRAARLDDLCELASSTSETGSRDRSAIAVHTTARARAALGLGELGRATELVDHIGQLREDDRFDPVVAALRGAIALEQGDARCALRPLQDTAARLGDPDALAVSGLDLVRVAEASARLGLPAEARQARDRLAALGAIGGIGVTSAHVAMAELWVALSSTGAPGEPEAGVADVAALECASTHHAQLALVAARQAWLIAPTAARSATVRRAAEEVEGAWSAFVVAHLDAAEAGDGERLMQLAARAADEGRRLDAAAVADRANAVHTAARSTRAAILAAVFAEQQMAMCGNARLLHERASASPQLSPREREIAEYAAEGWTNREIASRLHLSVRTVEGHILKACTKIGVQDRSELAHLLSDR